MVGPLLHQGAGRLHFAGERCCYAFIGYMEGVLCSGVTLAKGLAQGGLHAGHPPECYRNQPRSILRRAPK